MFSVPTFNPNHLVKSRHSLLSEGWSSSRIDRSLATGKLLRLHDGVYLGASQAASITTTERWLATLAGHCQRDPGRVIVSHRSAAVLHGFDGFNHLAGFDMTTPRYDHRPTDVLGLPIDVRAPFSSGVCRAPAIRSRFFDDLVTAMVYSLPVTGIAQTLADIGRFASVDLVEAAVESALRAVPPARPDMWNTGLLHELNELAKVHDHQRSTAALRHVLRRRGDCRPTGSYPETVLVQALRPFGVELARQPTIRILSPQGIVEAKLFPDLVDLDRVASAEVEGMEGHSSAQQLEHDADRTNLLSSALTVRRFAARAVLRNPPDVARSIAVWLNQLPVRPPSWSTPFATIVRTSEGLDIIRR